MPIYLEGAVIYYSAECDECGHKFSDEEPEPMEVVGNGYEVRDVICPRCGEEID